MDFTIGQKNKKLNVSWEIISGIVAIIALLLSVIQYRYSVSGVDAAYKWETSYAVNQSTAIIETVQHWTYGNVFYGINQTEGTVQTRYSIYYKKNSGSYVLEFGNGYATYNNTYYGEWFMHYASGYDKFTYKLIKETNKNVQSKMIVDLFVI